MKANKIVLLLLLFVFAGVNLLLDVTANAIHHHHHPQAYLSRLQSEHVAVLRQAMKRQSTNHDHLFLVST